MRGRSSATAVAASPASITSGSMPKLCTSTKRFQGTRSPPPGQDFRGRSGQTGCAKPVAGQGRLPRVALCPSCVVIPSPCPRQAFPTSASWVLPMVPAMPAAARRHWSWPPTLARGCRWNTMVPMVPTIAVLHRATLARPPLPPSRTDKTAPDGCPVWYRQTLHTRARTVCMPPPELGHLAVV